uniref:Tetratricopeptide repeat domain 7B n=1 Tax=Astyanax mexicanus TaxID=7994 RepID=A0A8B9JDJ2_ASTMX
MTARRSGSRLEGEIERCRGENQWEKIPELVKQLAAKPLQNDDLSELLLGEAKLQQYLKENPIKQGTSARGQRPRLAEVRKHLTAALERGNLKPEFLQEATLLMGKLSYVEGDHREALLQYSRVNLDDMQLVGAPVYRLSMIAEAYATKGLCLEKLPAASPSLSGRPADRDQEILTCYEKSGDIALLYLQEVEKALSAGLQNRSPKPGPVSQEQELGYFLETGLQRAHVIHFKNGNLTRGVGRFREILRAIETRTTQNLRMTIARQLAEILLRGMCEQSYWSPLEDPPPQSPLDDPHCPTSSSRDYALSRRPRVYSGENLFCPQENTEEALLLLLISESMANRDAVLSRIPEHSADRVISLQSASVVYDLLTIALGRRGQYEMLSECLERAMKFAFEEFHLWYQLALSLMAAGEVSILVFSISLPPHCVIGCSDAELGISVVAQSLSPTDHLAAFYLALQLAVSRQIPEALGYVRQALQLQGDDVHSLHLLALLLSAQKHYHDALNIIEMALSEYPENFMLLFTKVKLETLCHGPEEALLTCKHMLQIWKSCYNLTNPRRRCEKIYTWNYGHSLYIHAVVYIGMLKPAEALACTQEAASLFPLSHNVLFMKGQVAELRGNTEEAKRWYEEALSISPTHVKSMQRMFRMDLCSASCWNCINEEQKEVKDEQSDLRAPPTEPGRFQSFSFLYRAKDQNMHRFVSII